MVLSGVHELDSFDRRDRAVLRFAAAMSAGPRVSDEVFSATREHHSEREMVELIQVHGYYSMMARLGTLLDLDADV